MSAIYESKDTYEVLQSASRDPQRKELWQIQIINNVSLDFYRAFAPKCWKTFHTLVYLLHVSTMFPLKRLFPNVLNTNLNYKTPDIPKMILPSKSCICYIISMRLRRYKSDHK